MKYLITTVWFLMVLQGCLARNIPDSFDNPEQDADLEDTRFVGPGGNDIQAETLERLMGTHVMDAVEDPKDYYARMAMVGEAGDDSMEAIEGPRGPDIMEDFEDPDTTGARKDSAAPAGVSDGATVADGTGPAGATEDSVNPGIVEVFEDFPGSDTMANDVENFAPNDPLGAALSEAGDVGASKSYGAWQPKSELMKVTKREEAPEDDDMAEMRRSAPRARGCSRKSCNPCDSGCAGSVSCDPSGANSPSSQHKTTQLAQEAACEAQAAAAAQQAAGIQAANQVRSQLAEKACQASNSAQAALAGKQAMLDFLQGELAETQTLLEGEKKEVVDTSENEHLIKGAMGSSQQLAQNVAITAQQAANLACLLDKIDLSALTVEDEESALLIATQKKVEQLASMVEDARRDVEATCSAAQQAAAAAQASRQNAMRNRRKTVYPPQAYIAKIGKNAL